MIFRLQHIAIILIGLLALSCAGDRKTSVSESECKDVLASFSAVPTTTQASAARLDMLETIKASQETKFAEACSRFPGWTEQFESAYRQAVRETESLTSDDAVEGTVVKADE